MFPLINKRDTGINLRKIMDRQEISVKDVQIYLGLGSPQSVYHWLNGLSMPTIDNMYALSELFQLPIDALICGNKPKLKRNFDSEIDRKKKRIYMYCRKLNHELVA